MAMPRMTFRSKWRLRQHPVWAWRHRIAYRALEQRIGLPLAEGPVRLGAMFYVKPKRGPVGDLDNYLKAVKDALTKIIYVNDRQVCYYVEPTGIERVESEAQEGLRLKIQW